MKSDRFKAFFQKFFFDVSIDEHFEELYVVDDPIQYGREHTLDVVLRAITFLATIVLLCMPTLYGYSLFSRDLLIYVIVIFLVWIIALSKRFSYRFRVSFLLIGMYVSGIYDLWVVGLAEDGRIWLFMFVISTIIFVGRNEGIFAILLSGSSILSIGLSQAYGLLDMSQFKYGIDDLTPNLAIVFTITFMTGATIASIPVIVIIDALGRIFDGMKTMRQAQGEANEQLKNASQALKESLDAQQEMNRVQSIVIQTVSHEFRTPLSVISLSSNLLKKHNHKLDEARKTQYLSQIQHAVDHLSEMLSNVVSVNRIQEKSGQASYQSIPPKRLIKAWGAMINGTQKQHKDVKIQLNIVQQAESMLWTDPLLVNRVFQALLENAVRYSENKGNIVVSYQWDGDQLRWTISDKGMGIPETDLERIFQPFYRSNNAAHIPGVGVGLYQVRSILSEMGGAVLLSNQPEGSGVIAIVEIPTVAQGVPPVLEGKAG